VAVDVAVGAGSVWVLREDPGTVLRIDPSSLDVVAEIELGGTRSALAVG
jgi:hypothetical protein